MTIGVSVIVPSRNAGPWLLDAVRSAARESDKIVVDDGGNDAVIGLVFERVSGACTLRVDAGRGKGAGAARNTGQAAARHGVLVVLDADDLLAPGWRAALILFREGARR